MGKIKLNYDSPVADFIAQKILIPLMNYCPDTVSRGAFLWDEIFHLDERVIDEFRVRPGGHFIMPGLFKITPLQATRWNTNRKVVPRMKLWVRRDSTKPNDIEVEVEDPKAFTLDTQVFLLTKTEWNSIRPFIRKIKWPGTDSGG